MRHCSQHVYPMPWPTTLVRIRAAGKDEEEAENTHGGECGGAGSEPDAGRSGFDARDGRARKARQRLMLTRFAKKSASTFDVDVLFGREGVQIDTLFGSKIGLAEQNNKQNCSRIGLR